MSEKQTTIGAGMPDEERVRISRACNPVEAFPMDCETQTTPTCPDCDGAGKLWQGIYRGPLNKSGWPSLGYWAVQCKRCMGAGTESIPSRMQIAGAVI